MVFNLFSLNRISTTWNYNVTNDCISIDGLRVCANPFDRSVEYIMLRRIHPLLSYCRSSFSFFMKIFKLLKSDHEEIFKAEIKINFYLPAEYNNYLQHLTLTLLPFQKNKLQFIFQVYHTSGSMESSGA